MPVSPAPAWSWPVLHDAQRAVLLDVLLHGSRSRAELSRRTGLSRTSLSRLARDLVDLGFVSEGETVAGAGRGRPSEMLHLRPESAWFVGIKLTGDALYAVATDLGGTTVAALERPLPSREVDDVVELIADAVDELRRTHPRLAAIGVCLAGDVVGRDGDRRIIGSHFLAWENVPLAALVRERTGLPAETSNDVQALTAAHHWFGGGRGRPSLALIGMGAGIGAGLVVGDEPLRGTRGHPGKIGHLHVSDTGPSCDRGHVGCVSAYVTEPALTRNAGLGTLAEVFQAAASDRTARRAVEQAIDALGLVIAYLVNIADVEKVIVTGEGLPLALHDPELLRAAVDARLDPASEPAEIDLHPFRFSDYAWAAAASAIRLVL